MDILSAVDSFVPLWIFVPLLLIGIVGLVMTPKIRGRRNSQSPSPTTERSQPERPMRQAGSGHDER